MQVMSWGHSKLGPKCFQFMFEPLFFFQMRSFSLIPWASKSGKKTVKENSGLNGMSEEDVDAGFDFIFKNCPRKEENAAQLRWKTKLETLGNSNTGYIEETTWSDIDEVS